MENKLILVEYNIKKKQLLLKFNDDFSSKLSAEYLRIFNPLIIWHDKESLKKLINKTDISINKIEMVGNYALNLQFSDGYKQNIYSFDYLYNLSKSFNQNWKTYKNLIKEITKIDKKTNIIAKTGK